MGLACPSFTVPAGTSLPMPGATYGFTVALAGPNATWTEQGGSAQPLDATTHLPPSDKQPFGDIIFTADATSACRIYIAKSADQLKRLQPPTGGSTSTTISGGTITTITNPVTIGNNPGQAIPTYEVSALNPVTNTRSTSGTAPGSPTDITAALMGGTGLVASLSFVNTATTGNLLVYVGSAATNPTLSVLPGASVIVPSEQLSGLGANAHIFVSSLGGTVTYAATSLWSAF